MGVLTSNSSVIGVETTLVDKVKYLLGVVTIVEICTTFVAPVGTFRTLCREKLVLNLEVFCFTINQNF